MKTWITPEIEELSVSETRHGSKPVFPLDGEYTDKGFPYGANDPS